MVLADRRKVDTLEQTPPSDLVWIQTGFLGDIILTTAALRRARQFFPGVKQHLITTTLGCKALEGSELIDSLWNFEKKRAKGPWGLWTQLRQLRRSVSSNLGSRPFTLLCHRSTRSALLGWGLGWPVVAYREGALSWLATHLVDRVAVWHEADRLALLLSAFGIERRSLYGSRPVLPLNEAHLKSRIGNVPWDKQPVIALAPGSVWATKRWPSAHFAELLNKLMDQTTAHFLLLGSTAEQSTCTEISAGLRSESYRSRLTDLSGQTSLDDLRSVYPRLAMLISNDSSPVHYGSGYNVPTVTIFGPTTKEMGFGPLAEHSAAIGLVHLDCRPCSDHGPQVCPLGHFRCMKDLLPSVVFERCMTVWNQSQSGT